MCFKVYESSSLKSLDSRNLQTLSANSHFRDVNTNYLNSHCHAHDANTPHYRETNGQWNSPKRKARRGFPRGDSTNCVLEWCGNRMTTIKATVKLELVAPEGDRIHPETRLVNLWGHNNSRSGFKVGVPIDLRETWGLPNTKELSLSKECDSAKAGDEIIVTSQPPKWTSALAGWEGAFVRVIVHVPKRNAISRGSSNAPAPAPAPAPSAGPWDHKGFDSTRLT